MVQPTETNPTGVESYDHSRLARLPEHEAVSKALDDLVHAIQREGIALGQEEFLTVVVQMAASLGYADGCGEADCALGTHWPYRTEVGDGDLQGCYRCDTSKPDLDLRVRRRSAGNVLTSR